MGSRDLVPSELKDNPQPKPDIRKSETWRINISYMNTRLVWYLIGPKPLNCQMVPC